MKTKRSAFPWLVGLLVVGAAFLLISPALFTNTSNKLDGFASCLKDKGAIFYGAFWCPHCQNQKAMFGGSARFLPYVECSTPDGQGQTQICIDKGIQSYPTWVFPGGSRQGGEVPLKDLAQKSGCALPK